MIQNSVSRSVAARQLRRRRPEVIALALVLWSSAIWVMATPGPLDRFGTLKTTDFAQFYVSARLAATGQANRLYDWSAYIHELSQSVPGPAGLLYLPVYPPVLAAVLAPLGRLSYVQAALFWAVLSAVIYGLAGLWLVKQLPALRRDIVSGCLLLAGFPPFQQLLVYGQVSSIALLLVVLAWHAFVAGRRFWCGVSLGALVFKPQMLAVAAAAAVLAPGWALVAGIVTGVALELLLTSVVLGPAVFSGYTDTLRRIAANPGAFEPKPEQIQSLRGFFLALGGAGPVGMTLFVLAAVGVLLIAARATRRVPSSQQAFAIIVLTGLLLNPHLYAYDLVVLMVPLALAASLVIDAPVAHPSVDRVGRAAYVTYWLPLVAPALGLLHVQLMALAMMWLLWRLGQVGREPPTGRP